MIKVGHYNTLRVVKETTFGIYLEGNEHGNVLLPNNVVPEGTQLDDYLQVFVYLDTNDQIIATTIEPKVKVGECAYLKVIDTPRMGAFLDWGLDKDLLVPTPEQKSPMKRNQYYIVYVKLDNQGRIVASTKLDRFLHKSPPSFKQGDKVNVLIAGKTDLGNNVIINNTHWGLIHSSDIFQPLNYGEKKVAYIKNIRKDGKIDVTLRRIGQDHLRRDELQRRILDELRKQGGFIPLHDKSSSLDIQHTFNESKSSFKRAVGHLYKSGEITIEPNGIRLVEKMQG